MKKFFVFVVVAVLGLSACKEKEEVIPYIEDYYILITGVSTDSVQVEDTIEVYLNWYNSEYTENLTANIDGISAKIIDYKNDTTIVLIIPYKWRQGLLTINHPNGAYSEWWRLKKDCYPRISSINPLTGTAGTILTMKGKEFLASERTGVRINTLDCEILELNDSVIRFVVPDSCGNGMIKIPFWDSYDNECEPDKIIETSLFTYNKINSVKRRIKKYTEFGTIYSLERDAEGRVAKRIHIGKDNILYNNRYEIFRYSTTGFVDSIYYFDQGNLKSYKVYNRSIDNSNIEIYNYDNFNNLIGKDEYLYQNERLIDFAQYQKANGIFFKNLHNHYTYEGNGAILLRTFYNPDGTFNNDWPIDIEYDIYNGQMPALGIPGLEFFHAFPIAYYWGDRYYIYYNDFGELIKTERFADCDHVIIRNSFEYE